MASTTIGRRFPRGALWGSGANANLVSLAAVLMLAPLIAIVSASSELTTIGIVAATTVLLLTVLWSAEATFYVLIFSMLLSPEWVVGGLGGSAATASRGVTLRLDDYLISMIALAWLVRLAVYKEAAVFRRTPLNIPIAAYIGFSTLSTLFGALAGRLDLTTGFFFVMKYLEYTIIYFLVVNYVRDRDQIRRLLLAALATALIISVVAITQIPTGQRVTAPFEGERGEPNTLGGYLVIMIALALCFLSEAKTWAARVLWGTAVAIMTVPLVYTYSRTSWLAFCVMLITLIVVSRRKVIFLLLVGAFLVVLIASPPQALVERATYTLSSQSNSITFMGFGIEPSAGARLSAWGLAIDTLYVYPFAGAGVTGAGLVDAQYPRTIAETGLIGIALFIWLLVRIGRTGFALKDVASTTTEIVLATGFVAGFFGLLMHGVGANTFIIVRIMEPLWFIAGLVGASLLIHETEKHAASSGSPARALHPTRLPT